MINKIARIYCRVSTKDQDLSRQLTLADWAIEKGFYVAKVYAEKASGRNANRPLLQEMINDLQSEEVVIVESIDRLSRLPISEAEALLQHIKSKGARLLLPETFDLTTIHLNKDSMESIVFKSIEELLLKIMFKSASDDYELRRIRQAAGIKRAKLDGKKFGRRISQERIEAVAKCWKNGFSISETAIYCQCCISTVKRIRNKLKKGEYKSRLNFIEHKDNKSEENRLC